VAPKSLDDPNPSSTTLAAWSTHLGRTVSDPAALRIELGAGATLPRAFAATARRFTHAKALTVGGVTLSHGQVDDESVRLSAILGAWGVRRGSRILLVAEPVMPVVICYLAALRAGAIVTLTHPSYTSLELSRMITASGADLAVATGDALGRLVEATPDGQVLGVEESDRDKSVNLLYDLAPQMVPEIDDDATSTAILASTSGTTGSPKLVPLSNRNLLSSIRGVLWAWRWRPDDRLVHCLPIAHQHGLGAIHAALLTGSHTIILPRFEPAALLDVIAAEEATVLFAVPAIYDRLLTDDMERLRSLAGLRLMTSGSAPLPSEHAIRIEALTGQLPVERYGLTETGLDSSNPYEGPRIPGTVGLPLPGVELAVVDPTGTAVASDEAGEVVLRGPQVFSGYWGEEPDSPDFMHGWFRTGDMGVIDPDSGHLRLVGRTKELIITGGMNVFPREVEAALLTIPGVIDVAVIGVPSRRWGEAVTAFVVATGVSIDEIARSISDQLAPYKRPKQIIEVDSIPRTEIGKLKRDVLAASHSIRDT
jgi:malonyl-CoA/methylmalonyl-CoA synthetase